MSPKPFFKLPKIIMLLAVAGITGYNLHAKEHQFADGHNLLFVENKGQVTDQYQKHRNDIDFSLRGIELNVFIGKGQLHYQWAKTDATDNADIVKQPAMPGKREMIKDMTVEMYRMDVELLGANIHAKAITETTEDYYENYYLPQCPEGLTARAFSKITYPEIYPNIDWVIYTNGSSLKYDFVVHKGGDAADIKLVYKGATALELKNGQLTAATPFGSVTEHKPYTYDAATKQEIASGYVLNGNTLSFNIAANNGDIVIDPTIGWGTYFGSSDLTYGLTVAANLSGAAYLGGTTMNTSTIATTGNHQYIFGGGATDAYIVKFNLNGTKAWSTYYGGESADEILTAACDAAGNLYVGGVTSSIVSGIASSGAHQTSNPGTGFGGTSTLEGFLAKFNSSGVRQWGSFYGGSMADNVNAIAVDKNGNVFIGGTANSTAGIVTSGAHQVTFSPAFLAKFNSSGVRQWGTYYGDNSNDAVNAVTCDTSGNVFIGGYTESYIKIATMGTHQSMNAGGTADGFVAKFDATGQRLWGSYYGGTALDYITAISCDRYNNVFAVGNTLSSGLATTGVHQVAPVGAMEGVIARFDATDGQRIWGSYFGGSGNEMMGGIYAGHDRKVYVAGTTRSLSGMATAGNYQTVFGGSNNMPGAPGDGFLAKFSFEGKRLWGTYYGGSGDEGNVKLAYGGGKLYIGGLTPSGNNIATTNGFQNTGAPTTLAFCAQFEADTAVYFDEIYWDTTVCLADTLFIKYDVTNNFRPGNIFTLQMSDASGSFTNPININSIATTGGGIFKYWVPDTLTLGTGYRIRIIASTFPDTTWNNGKNIRVSDYAHPVAIAQFPICANGTLVLVDNGTGPGSTDYKWTGPGNFSIGQRNYNRPNVQFSDAGWYVLTADNYSCITKDSVQVQISGKPNKPVIHSNSPVCVGDTLKVWATTTTPGITDWTWQKPSGYSPFTSGDTTIPIVALTDAGVYKAVAIAGGCPSDIDSVIVTVDPKVVPTVQVGASPSNPGLWVDVQFTITGSSNTGTSPTYQWMKNGVDIANATGNSYTAKTGSDLQEGDSICVSMTSSEHCASPLTAKSCMGIHIDLGVKDINAIGTIGLYPNPNNGIFTLKGKLFMDAIVNLQVINTLGQVVYQDAAKPVDKQINKQVNIADLPKGIYLLHMKTELGNSALKFSVE